MKKKLILAISMIAVLICLFAICINAASVELDGVIYNTNDNANYEGFDGNATVSASNRTATTKVVVIPEAITVNEKNYKVTAVENNAFNGNTTVETIVIYPKLKEIPSWMVQGAKNLKKLYIDFSEVVTIGSRSLTLATKDDMNPVEGQEFKIYTPESYITGTDVEITTVNFDKVTSIGSGAFNNTSLKYVTIGKECKSIGIQTFRFGDLIEITVESDADIPNYFCADNASLSKIKIGKPTTVGTHAFASCKSVTEVRADMSAVTSVSGNAFCFSSQYDGGNNTAQWYNLNGEKIVDLTSVETLEGGGKSGAFASSNIGSATIIWPKAITVMKDQAFRKCNIKGTMCILMQPKM